MVHQIQAASRGRKINKPSSTGWIVIPDVLSGLSRDCLAKANILKMRPTTYATDSIEYGRQKGDIYPRGADNLPQSPSRRIPYRVVLHFLRLNMTKRLHVPL